MLIMLLFLTLSNEDDFLLFSSLSRRLITSPIAFSAEDGLALNAFALSACVTGFDAS